MPNARRRPRYSTGVSRPKAMRVSPPKPKPQVNVEELRQQLAGFKKDVDVQITQDDITGNFSAVVKFVRDRAEKSGFVFEEVELRRIQSGRYRDQIKWVIRGKRDYTDDELRKEGAKLLEQKKKADAKAEQKRNKDLATIRRLASEHGLPDPTITQVVDKRRASKAK